MKPNGTSWKPIGPCGTLAKPNRTTLERQWNLVELCRTFWNLLYTYGTLWNLVEPDGTLETRENPMDAYSNR